MPSRLDWGEKGPSATRAGATGFVPLGVARPSRDDPRLGFPRGHRSTARRAELVGRWDGLVGLELKSSVEYVSGHRLGDLDGEFLKV